MRNTGVALITSLLVAFGGGTALAQSSSQSGYDETLGEIGQIDTQQPSNDTQPTATPAVSTPAPVQAAPASTGSDLPFTGLDVGIVLGAGILLAGTGVVLRRTTRPQKS